MWDVQKAVQHLNEHAEASSKGYCARYVKAAISAGGDISSWPSIVSAKDYGPALVERGFNIIPATDSFVAGDVVIIQGFNKADFPAGEIKKDHPHGHMAMFNGQQWVSDFKQNNGYYPGGDYRKAKPVYVFYRHKDVEAQSSEKSTVSDNRPLKTCFPSCKQNGEQYATVDEMMALIGREPHGSWLAGTNRMWHGGIHLTEVSAPGAVLKPETQDSAVPLQCMADGEVVAWRLNQDYKKNSFLGHSIQYTTTFVLVKSVCKPDLEKENTWLEFYSLYMGLAPLSAFKKCKCMKAKTKVLKRKAGNYESSQGSEGSAPAPAPEKEKLAKDSRVLVLEETTFMNGSVAQPFGLAQQLDKDGNVTGKTFWVTLLPEYMAEDGEEYAHLPTWMKQAVAKSAFDSVEKPDSTLKISAGDAIGFLGEDIAPASKAEISDSTFAHIEVLCTDSRMPAFIDNPGNVITGRKYIRVHSGAVLYTNSGSTFTKTTSSVSKDMHIILPVDKCNPKESEGQTYYQVGQNYWLCEDNVDVKEQYYLKELGFTALVEENTPDMSASLKEGWMKSAYQWLAGQVRPERGIQEQQMSSFYKGMVDKMDTDNDGQLSERELFTALHHPEMGVRDIVSRMIVKHESEWFGGSSHQKWTAFFQDYDILRIDLAKRWLDDMEWMSKVEPFTSGKAVWHMHPVIFLNAIDEVRFPKTPVNGVLVPLEFFNFYNGDVIGETDFELAAEKLQCEVAAIKAVAKTETGSSGSYFKFETSDDYVPAILFERHHFHKYTNGAYDSHADISNRQAGGYGRNSEQYPKLLRAYALDKRSALLATSWGKFQILASNYQAAGYSSPEAFVKSMSESEKNQLAAFVTFIKSDSVLLQAIRSKDWLAFALRYNGPKQKDYDTRMRGNYEKSK